VFVHKSELPEGYTVRLGDRVTYRLASNTKHPNKMQAVDVRLTAAA